MNQYRWSKTWKILLISAGVVGGVRLQYALGDKATVIDKTPPKVTIKNPADSATVTGIVSLTAEASDDIGVTGVQWKIDGINVGNPVSEVPYSYDWNARNESKGKHIIFAVASDAAGNSSQASVTVNVGNNRQMDNRWVYQDSLIEPWINASWDTKVSFTYRKKVYDGKRSIKVTQQRWGALSFRLGNWGSSKPIDTSKYQSLQFSIYGGSRGVDLVVMFENDDSDTFPLANFGLIPPYTWIDVSIPISDLNPNNQPVSRLDIQDSTGSRRTYIVDEIRFVAE